MLSVKEAQEKVLNSAVRIKTKSVPILDSLGLILAEDMISGDNIPAFDNATMDGFAAIASDTIGADKNYPVKLKLAREDIQAGKVSTLKIEPGYCISIMTGAPIPDGCDCVVVKEDTLKEGTEVLIFKEYDHGENIRYKGEDILEGDTVLKKGKKIYPGDIGVMASIGHYEVIVNNPPVVGILTTGNELIGPGNSLEKGKVRDSNSYSLAAQIKEIGAFYKIFGIVPDEKMQLMEKIKEAISNCDILLVTGGVSVGDYDYVKEILNLLGADCIFWKVNQKPGKPLAFYTYNDKFIFGLPGNPVSVMICFEMYVRPLIRKMVENPNYLRLPVLARASDNFGHYSEGRTDFIRVIVEKKDDGYYFKPTGLQGSGILTSMSEANGLAMIPDNVGEIEKDKIFEVFLLKE
ncbi:MAG: molybdopterin molybdotransferase MoeA [Actinobacteria bacterium]|nr:molybdopterin molybdotransferase MoeA [Actinomycetota bacterium]